MYDVLTIDQKIIRNCSFVPFSYNNIRIDFKLTTLEDFNNTTQYYSTKGISDLYDLDFLSTVKDISAYSLNHKHNYIPDIVIILTILYNTSLIIGSTQSIINLYQPLALQDNTNPTPTKLDISKNSKNYTRIYSGNTIIIIDNVTGTMTIDTKNSIVLNTDTITNIANKINIGSVDPTHKAVLGDILEDAFNKHKHMAPTGPTGVPLKLLDGSELSTVTKLNK